ncbi:unnamed protein product [Protopolystoma xenopodis]|uniref:Calpain catalytic domain-containing protein n=1 Tax=Protopolystoma xenopodis TaxID=117903 RepID=A0A3S5AHW7_9PLAT|nr:unnamed protein product [Protopolystoma xenopodis]
MSAILNVILRLTSTLPHFRLLLFALYSSLINCRVCLSGCLVHLAIQHRLQLHENQVSHIEMIRLRNPWGNDREWSGAWSDQSSEWRRIPAEERRRIGLTFDHDGEFWYLVKSLFLSNVTDPKSQAHTNNCECISIYSGYILNRS